MHRFLILPLAFLMTTAAQAQEFVGNLRFTEAGCEASRKCFLAEPFGFKSMTVGNWESPANVWTNGASIPTKVLQKVIGNPFDADLVKAAVIHDHYCGRKVRSWSDTHWAFYEALRASGVSKIRAATMYVGVILGAQKWIRVRQGEPCKLTESCVQTAGDTPLPSGGTRVIDADGTNYWVRKARDDDASLEIELSRAVQELSRAQSELTRRELEAIAKNLRPNDRFINGPDVIVRRSRKRSNAPTE